MSQRPSSIHRPRTLSIGGATYDLFVRTGPGVLQEDRTGNVLLLPLGSKIRVDQVIETCGGGAANTAVGLARLGCASHFCGILGSDQWGQRQLENFKKEGVDARCTTIVEGETSSFSIILSAGSGERVIFYDPGTNAHLHDVTFDRESIARMQWIYLNHIHEASGMIEQNIASILAESPDVRLTWNPGGNQLKRGIVDPSNKTLLRETDVIICNREEAMQFAAAASEAAARTALLAAGVRIVCICNGKEGATTSDGTTTWHCPIIEDAEVVDTTGAGDAFGTGFTWALTQDLPLSDALRAGTINATSVIGTMGAEAGLLTDIEMRAQLKTTKLDVVESNT